MLSDSDFQMEQFVTFFFFKWFISSEGIGGGVVIMLICSGMSLKTLRLTWSGTFALDDPK